MKGETTSRQLLSLMGEFSNISLTCQNKDVALSKIAELSKQVLGSRLCTITLVDLHQKILYLAACAGCEVKPKELVDERRIRLGSLMAGDAIDYQIVAKGEPIEVYELQDDGKGIAKIETTRRYGLKSALCHPVKSGKRLIGYLNHFSSQSTSFSEVDREMIAALANQTAAILTGLENLASRRQLLKLDEITQRISEVRDIDHLLRLVLEEGLKLVGAPHGLIGRFDLRTGEIKIIDLSGTPSKQRPLQPGEGIVGQSLREERPIRIPDVRDSVYWEQYVEFWPDTRSELAVPILVRGAEVRVGREKERAPKPLGMLNLESPQIAAFSEEDEALLWSLAQRAAQIIDKLELDRKVAGLAKVQQELLGKQDWHEILQDLGRAITQTLDYEYVNISLVKPELGRISTEFVRGLSERDIEAFKRLANHSLESNDIQADIVRHKATEVPNADDERFDQKIYKRFDHSRFIRVFVPMIAQSDGHVVGTVEAGYDRSFRKYIYEQDIEILNRFVDYATRALERRERGFLNRISHELRAPIVGIRNNAIYLQKKYHDMEPNEIQRKFDDIMVDCQIALLQVKELEYILGRIPPDDKVEATLVFRDIIIKTIRQIKPLVEARGFEPSNMEYDRADIHKIGHLYINRAKLGQVVYNILLNSIKYAESDADSFSIRISVDDTKDFFILRFRDWGIGIRKGLETRVFEEGYRTPEAIEKDVTGSGLGLTISRKIMEDMGGDLRLAHTYKPTEFQVWLPQGLKEAPRDTVRR